MKKKLTFFISLVIIIILCAVWSPWQAWDITLPEIFGVEAPEEFARLQVSSLAGEIEITLDGEKQGSVGPEGSPFLIEDISPGKKLLTLTRVSDDPEAYISIERLINFDPKVDTVIAYELGPTEAFSEGHIITAFKSYINKDSTKLNITSNVEGVDVYFDSRNIGQTPLNSIDLNINTVHKLKFEKKGYEPLEISLLPEEEEERVKLAGYDINLEVNLFLIPIRTK